MKKITTSSKFFYIIKGYKLKFIFLSFFLFIQSLLDVIGLGIIIPFISLLTDNNEVQAIINNILNLHLKKQDLIFFCGYLIIFLFFIKLLIQIKVNFEIVKFYTKANHELRETLIKKYLYMNYEDYVKRNSSQYIYNIQVACAKFCTLYLQSVLRSISEVLLVLFIFIFLFIQHPIVVLSLLTIFVLILILYDKLLRKKLYLIGKNINKLSTNLIKNVQEIIKGLKEIRVYKKERFFYKKSKSLSIKIFKLNYILDSILFLPRYILEFLVISLFIVSIFLIIIIEIPLIEAIPTITIFSLAIVRMLPSLNRLISYISNFRNSKNFLEIMYSELSKNKNIKIHEDKETSPQEEIKSISFQNISFSFKENFIFKNINFKINKGEKIGIYGKSGSGKSTLVNLVLGLLKPNKGKIIFKTSEKSTTDRSIIENQIAYLPQEVVIINQSVTENIYFGDKDKGKNKNNIASILKKVNLFTYFKNKKDKFNTILGENGSNISGGQKQRVALARAIFLKKNILVMDESTSGLDQRNESKILDEIFKIMKGKTIILISHNKEILKKCDKVFEIKNKKIYVG